MVSNLPSDVGQWSKNVIHMVELTHWHLERFAKIVFFFDFLMVLKLDRRQISFSLVENALVTRQLTVLATRIAFKTFWPRYAQK